MYPPRFGTPEPHGTKVAPRRFSVIQSIGGHEVIDFDGRPVAERDFEDDAQSLAAGLNEAAFSGPKDLARAIQNIA